MSELDKLKRIKAICDMDDVITHNGLLYLINEYLGTSYILADFKDFYMQNIIPEEQKDDFFKFFFSKNVYDYCDIAPNCYKVLEEINKYYDLCIGTSYVYPDKKRDSGIIAMYKHFFLLDNFPFLTPDNFGFVNKKSFLKGEIRIDDAMKNLMDSIIKLLYPAYHNLTISDEKLKEQGIVRVKDWLDIERILIKEKGLILKRIYS